MARSQRGPRKLLSCKSKWVPRHAISCPRGPIEGENQRRKTVRTIEKGEFVNATCPVCMEFPHNGVLLLCSSHEKGCRPFMCGTNYKHSNCLEQYMKAYSKLACPLCRGEVKGWTTVEPAREYLNSKMRGCMQDGCSFVGNYKELRKHMRADHPAAKRRESDPILEERWRSLERERNHEDVISVIRASTPGAVVLGDYVIEWRHRRWP